MEPMEALTDGKQALRGLAGAMIIGVVCIVAYALHAGGSDTALSMTSVGILLAGASAFIGGALGFLFAIPRTLQQDGAPSQQGESSEKKRGEHRVDYRANTNLEQISDWLTKILVGVSLTQIPQIKDGLVSLSTFAGKGLGAQGQIFAMALLLYAFVLGFLFGYLWTRLFLAGALRVADQAAIGTLTTEVQKAAEKAESAERKLEALKKQSELDAAALNLTYRQLNPNPDLPGVTQDELDAAVTAASRPVRVQIFNQAWQVRSENWRTAETKPKMERTIPLFRALIRSDTQNRYHMNHGQLGFALKDRLRPEWAEAAKELSTAIKIRGDWQKAGWLFYEFNRALCTIKSDPEFLRDAPSQEEQKSRILNDLKAALHAEEIRPIFDSTPEIGAWISLNGITPEQLEEAGGDIRTEAAQN